MGSCCSSKSEKSLSSNQTVMCPSCQARAKAVGLTTLLHQVKAPLNQDLSDKAYFFCDQVDCDTVYFSLDGLCLNREQVRDSVGQKSADPERTLCYCFNITDVMVSDEIRLTGASSSKAFVVEQTKIKNCACDIRNPSGRCCLRNFLNDRKTSIALKRRFRPPRRQRNNKQ